MAQFEEAGPAKPITESSGLIRSVPRTRFSKSARTRRLGHGHRRLDSNFCDGRDCL